MVCAAVEQVITSHSCDNDVPQLHTTGSFRHARRFIFVQWKRASGGNGAKAAGPRAMVAGNHESSGALAPAFPVVGTFGALANGMELELVEQSACVSEAVGVGKADAQPMGKPRARRSLNALQGGHFSFPICSKNPPVGRDQNPPAPPRRLQEPEPNPARTA